MWAVFGVCLSLYAHVTLREVGEQYFCRSLRAFVFIIELLFHFIPPPVQLFSSFLLILKPKNGIGVD